jgi:hypothetical protein
LGVFGICALGTWMISTSVAQLQNPAQLSNPPPPPPAPFARPTLAAQAWIVSELPYSAYRVVTLDRIGSVGRDRSEARTLTYLTARHSIPRMIGHTISHHRNSARIAQVSVNGGEAASVDVPF